MKQRTMRLADCEQCGEQYEQTTKRQRYCGPRCSSKHFNGLATVPLGSPAYGDGLSFQTKGALSELRAAVDLLARGYHVYRSMSSSAPWDIVVAIPSGRLVRVEVKTAVLMADGSARGGSLKRNVYDVLCFVTRDGIVYEPPIEEW